MRQPRDAGTSTLEFVGVLPVIVVVLIGLLQGGVALYGASATQAAARDGARAAALGRDVGVAVRTSLPTWLPAQVTTFGPDNGVRVRVDLPDVVPGRDLVVQRQAVLP